MPKVSKSVLGKRTLSDRSDQILEVAIPEPNETVPSRSDWEIYKNAEGKFYNQYLMQADLDKNANKYYIIQLLKHKT